jgi:hypothetical protein
MFRKYTFSALLALAGCCVLSNVANAQEFFGLQVDLMSGTQAKTVFVDKDAFSDVVNKSWTPQIRAKGDKAIEQAVAAANAKMPKGVNLYSQKSQLTARAETSSQLSGKEIVVQSVLKGNALTFTSTTPTPLGKWADPKFSITYDLSVKVTIQQKKDGSLFATAVGSIQNLQLHSQNLSADVVKFFDAVSAFMGGSDFIKMAETSLRQMHVDLSAQVNQALIPINKALGDARNAGLTKLTEKVDPGTKHLVITLSK